MIGVCPRCGEEKELKDARPHWCVVCFRAYQNRWRAMNKERVAAYDRRQQLRQYGLTEKDVEEERELQAGLCGGCFMPADLVVDHHHESGVFRGLLCQSCNKVLGFAKDRPWVLRQLADYLEMTEHDQSL